MHDSDTPLRGALRFLVPYRKPVLFGCAMLLATSALALTIPYYLGKIVDALRAPSPSETIPRLALFMGGLAIFQALTRIWSRVAIFNAARMAEFDIRSKLFRHLLSMDQKFMSSKTSGDLMSRLTSDVQTLRALWGPAILNVVNTTFIFSVALFLMFRIDWRLTLWAALPYPAMVGLGAIFGRQIYRASRAVQEELGFLTSRVQEDLSGIGVIRTYGLERAREDKFQQSSSTLLKRNMKLALIRGQLAPVLGGVASLGTVAVLWVGGHAVAEGRIGLGQLIQFNGYLLLLVWPTLALGWMLSLFQRGFASYQRVQMLLGTPSSIQDGNAAPGPLKGKLEIKNFSLSLGGIDVLKNVSISIDAGQTVAIVGRTGSGKSVLIDSIARIHDVPRGSIFIDGHDIVDLPLHTLRGALGYAPQDAFLFSRTLSENILMGLNRGDSERPASEEDILSAARSAGLARDLDTLPNGLETMVGERGVTLSGGQRQRVALARALATKPAVLLLDDSLSSVDAETEKTILTELETETRDRTSILISHRVAAVTMADVILVMDEGRVVEQGTHEQLLAKNGVYSDVYRSQIQTGGAL